MARNDRTIDRRTVLQSVGVALAATAGGAGVAAASDFQSGDCAVTTGEGMTFDAACPLGNHTGYVEGGVTGQVLSTCTDADGEDWAYFSPGRTIEPAFWVRERLLAHC